MFSLNAVGPPTFLDKIDFAFVLREQVWVIKQTKWLEQITNIETHINNNLQTILMLGNHREIVCPSREKLWIKRLQSILTPMASISNKEMTMSCPWVLFPADIPPFILPHSPINYLFVLHLLINFEFVFCAPILLWWNQPLHSKPCHNLLCLSFAFSVCFHIFPRDCFCPIPDYVCVLYFH